MADQTRWERLEEWIFDHEHERFTSHDVADGLECSTPEASLYIQCYLEAQRKQNSRTLYVLKREGRTTAAVWSVGQRVLDARMIGGTLFEDVACKVHRAFEPDLRRLAHRNPRAAKYAERKIVAVVDGALVTLAAAVDQIDDDD